MRICIITYGCQMNERDSERLAALLRRQGYQPTSQESAADVVIVNTCSIREKAEQKALGKLRLLIDSKAARPERIIGAVGCMAQRLGLDILRQVQGLDFAVGTHRLSHLPSLLDLVRNRRCQVVDVQEISDSEDQSCHEPGRVTAFINILFGCNRRCTYCIVPRVRGAEWSRSAQEIIAEARELVSDGVKEITLLGQSIMSYGRSNPVWADDYRSARGFIEPLPRLFEALQEIPGLQRIRFTSGHPSGCTPELVRAMLELPAMCEHLHLPLQSGSDRILQRMNRGYTLADYRQAVQRLRASLPDIAITTDIIVGFPSETMDDFAMTRAALAEIGFDNAFIFKYSSRPGVPASFRLDDVSAEEKLQRNHILLTEQNSYCLTLNQRCLGQRLEVLLEGPSRRNPERWMGRTRTNKIVLLDAEPDLHAGDLISVMIKQAKMQTLYGSLQPLSEIPIISDHEQ